MQQTNQQLTLAIGVNDMTAGRLGGGLAFLAALVLASCQCGPVPCKSTGDCGQAQVCLQNQTCAPQCSTSNQCPSTEKCSTAGGCVPKDGCGADTDCNGDKVCGPGASCIASCINAGCPSGQRCDSRGHCQPVPVQDGGSCGGELLQTSRVQANFLIAEDKSGSMRELAGSQAKWAIAQSAVKQITSQNQGSIRFGLVLFPGSQNCLPAPVAVQVGDNTAAAIAAALDATSPSGNTPIAGVLNLAAGVQGLQDPTRSNYVLLVTDGKETCGGNPIPAVQALFAKGIKTYVVGFGGAVDPSTLTTMAIEGGTARAVIPRYYQADDAAGLNGALSSIAQGAIGCDFKLGTVPPDPAKLYVYVNGQLVTRDPAKVNGWEYHSAGNRITLYGPTCDAVSSLSAAKLQIVYGCPDDSLVEGGGGGVFDAGAIPRLPNGSACYGGDQCLSGKCLDRVCSPGRPNGSLCASSDECASGHCIANICEGGKPDGSPCTGNNECLSGLCQNNVCTTQIN